MGDGEDGPTHQPVEHLASLRAIPGLVTLRPGDANEVVEAYRYIMPLRHEPAVLVLSRQPLPTLDRSKYASAAGVARGACVLADAPNGKPDLTLMPPAARSPGRGGARDAVNEGVFARRLDAVLTSSSTKRRSTGQRLPPGVTAASRSSRRPRSAGSATSGGDRPGHRHADLGARRR
jgi:transketolase